MNAIKKYATKIIALSSLLFCTQLYPMRIAKKATKRVIQYGQQLLSRNQGNDSHTAIIAVPITEQSVENKEKITYDLIPGFPNDVSRNILREKVYKKPWKNFDHLLQLKTVCKAWEQSIGTKEQITAILDIPPLHYAAMTNDAQKIVQLKLQGDSILAPDTQRLCAVNYALACDKVRSFKVLGLGFASDDFLEESKNHTFKENSAIEKFLSSDDPQADAYTLGDLKQTIDGGDDHYEKAIDILFHKGNLAIEYLLDDSPKTKNKVFRDLMMYCIQSFTESYLFSHVINNLPYQSLCFALLEQGFANPNTCDKNGSYLLNYLCYTEKKDYYPVLTKLLSLKSINVNVKNSFGITPLHNAAYNGYLDALTALLKTGKCDIEALTNDGITPLCSGTIKGNYNCIKSLIENGANVAFVTSTNENLLHIATMYGHTKILDLLIPLLKQYINQKNNLGRTPLIYCVLDAPKNAHICMKSLIKAGANIDAITDNGQVALHYAAGWNTPELTEILLENGANVNAQIKGDTSFQGINYDLFTPLHLAAQRGHGDIIELLLKHGANTALKTATGKTALDLAQEYGHTKAVKLLTFEQNS